MECRKAGLVARQQQSLRVGTEQRGPQAGLVILGLPAGSLWLPPSKGSARTWGHTLFNFQSTSGHREGPQGMMLWGWGGTEKGFQDQHPFCGGGQRHGPQVLIGGAGPAAWCPACDEPTAACRRGRWSLHASALDTSRAPAFSSTEEFQEGHVCGSEGASRSGRRGWFLLL